uniref:Uncharacterized protein n=1 Tax=Arundo donax TaxID=35708 RepID=A0A0A9HQN0_ARUDO
MLSLMLIQNWQLGPASAMHYFNILIHDTMTCRPHVHVMDPPAHSWVSHVVALYGFLRY